MPSAFDDDDFTTDSNTVMTKAIMTKDGKCVHHPWIELRGKDSSGHLFQRDYCPECNRQYEANKEALRRRKLEIEREMQALESISISGRSTSTGSNTTTEKNAGKPSSGSANKSGNEPYRPPPPLPSGHSSNISGTVSPDYFAGGYAQSSGPLPFNPYDPRFFAAAAAAYHQQHGAGVSPSPPLMEKLAASSASQPTRQMQHQENNYVLKMLQDKEDEVKSLRKTLEDTQAKLQEQSLLATRLQTTLDQVTASFDQERKLIRLKAEKEAQEVFQAKQQEIFQKQLELMDKWRHGNGDPAIGIEQLPPAVLKEAPAADTLAPSPQPEMYSAETRSAVSAASSSNTEVTTNTNGMGRNYGPEETIGNVSASSKDKKKKEKGKNSNNITVNDTHDENQGFDKNVGGNPATTNGTLQESMDASLINSGDIDFTFVENIGDDDDDDDRNRLPIAPPPTPAANKDTSSSTSASNAGASDVPYPGQSRKQVPGTQPSDTFTPVCHEPTDPVISAGATSPYPEISPSDDETIGVTVASSTYGEDRIKVVNKELLDPYGDKGNYTGIVLRTTGMPHGLGRMIYEEDGRVYEGDWRHGRWHGYGCASFSNGDSYEGEYKFDQRHGKGIYKWHDGRIYDGAFHEDKRHGKGIFTWPDGAIYDGEFVNGQREGQGKYTFADGGQYEGGWKDGRYDGYGTCTWEDGRRYQGEWRNGMAHGRGIETYPNGNIRHEGQWIDDEPVR